MKELSGAEKVALAGADVVAINAIVARLTGLLKPNAIRSQLEQMCAALGESASGPEELSIPVDRGVSGDLRSGVLIVV